jgi:hypothetical protein
MHGPINVKSLNNTSKWQVEFKSAFKGLNVSESWSLTLREKLRYRLFKTRSVRRVLEIKSRMKYLIRGKDDII